MDAVGWFVIIVSGAFFLYAIVALFLGLYGELVRASRAEGRREALKLAIELARERSDIAVCTAPEGDLKTGLVRAQVAHSIEMELRAALADVR